jgi:hypothetical protein
MARQPADAFWCRDKVKQAFMKLCKASFVPHPDWSKFRQLDKHGIFNQYTNARLSMKFRKLWLIEHGFCYMCGTRPMETKGGLCSECQEKMKSYLQPVKKSNKK